MHPTKRRIVGTIALAIPFSAILIRGAPPADNMSVWAMLGTTALVAVTFYFMWPIVESIWRDRAPAALTWNRFASLAGIGVLLTIAIVLGGKLLRHDLDLWLVLAYAMLIAMLTFVGGGRETAMRLRSRR